MAESLWAEIDRWKKEYRWVDLSHPLGPETPHWAGFEALALKPLYTYESTDGVFQAFEYTLSGQYGTHTDFPRHFDPNGRWQHEFGVQDMIFKLVVIDKAAEAAKNHDYEVSRQDVLDFEKAHGTIPAGAFVAWRSDWHKRPASEFEGKDADGNSHYPGWSLDALKLLLEERKVVAIGHETPDTDSAVFGGKTNMACEQFVLDHDALNVELLANLDQVPPVGAIAFVTYPNVTDGVGFTSRVFAIAPK